MFTLFILLFKSSYRGMMPDTIIEFPSDSRGIANSGKDFEVWLDFFSRGRSFASVYCMIWSGKLSCNIVWTWTTMQPTLASRNSQTLTRYLCLTFLRRDSHSVSLAYCLVEQKQFLVFPLSYYCCCFCFSCNFLSFYCPCLFSF